MKFQGKEGSSAEGDSFDDRWAWDEYEHDKWLDAIQSDCPQAWQVVNLAHVLKGRDMAAFMCWLGVRLMEMHRILRLDGSIYVHIDHTAHAYVKCLMDAIFGKHNFRNEIVWAYGKWTNSAKYFQRNHDIILFYTKSDQYIFNKQYRMTDNKRNVIHRGWGSNRGHKNERQLLVYDRAKAAKEIMKPKYDKIVYLDDKPAGTAMSDIWDDIHFVGGSSKERTGYPTQKPIALYERIIKASSNEGDIVLDPFYGSGTTLVAAERLGRQWGRH